MKRHERSREVVKLAALEVNDSFVKGALQEDSRGAFEKAASDLLNNESARAAMVANNMTEDDLVREAAIVLAYNALTAELLRRKKK